MLITAFQGDAAVMVQDGLISSSFALKDISLWRWGGEMGWWCYCWCYSPLAGVFAPSVLLVMFVKDSIRFSSSSARKDISLVVVRGGSDRGGGGSGGVPVLLPFLIPILFV